MNKSSTTNRVVNGKKLQRNFKMKIEKNNNE